MRKEKNGTRYFSFEELACEYFHMKPVSKQIQNQGKRKDLQQKFETRNTCKSCNTPMTYLGGNVLCCNNPNCDKGFYRLLDSKSKSIAQSIYGEGGVNI